MNEPNEVALRIIDFVRGIGLHVRFERIEGRTPLPGISVDRGSIVVDRDRWLYPGDLLHEAGHLAVLTPAARTGEAPLDSGGDEMAAIAWSYAAALHLGIDPSVVFHADGYRGDSPMILENFAAGRTFGVPLLAWYGLTREGKRGQSAEGTYPAMHRWLRE